MQEAQEGSVNISAGPAHTVHAAHRQVLLLFTYTSTLIPAHCLLHRSLLSNYVASPTK